MRTAHRLHLPMNAASRWLDPHGNLAETVLLHVPRNRSNVTMPRHALVTIG